MNTAIGTWTFVALMIYGAGLLTGFSIALKVVEFDLKKRMESGGHDR